MTENNMEEHNANNSGNGAAYILWSMLGFAIGCFVGYALKKNSTAQEIKILQDINFCKSELSKKIKSDLFAMQDRTKQIKEDAIRSELQARITHCNTYINIHTAKTHRDLIDAISYDVSEAAKAANEAQTSQTAEAVKAGNTVVDYQSLLKLLQFFQKKVNTLNSYALVLASRLDDELKAFQPQS